MKLIARAALLSAAMLAGTTATGYAADAVTFYENVAPILQANCVSCHRPSGQNIGSLVAPMSLMTYEEARPWARSIALKVQSKQMPPARSRARLRRMRRGRSRARLAMGPERSAVRSLWATASRSDCRRARAGQLPRARRPTCGCALRVTPPREKREPGTIRNAPVPAVGYIARQPL